MQCGAEVAAVKLFISLEGADGSGKTTQAAKLVTRLEAKGYRVVPVHEPGGTELGNDIRGLLLRRNRGPIDPWAEAMLFSACRAQLVAEVIRPALAAGAIVVVDRFADSTLAYQGTGRGLSTADLALLIRLATGGLQPDVTVLLDVPARTGLERIIHQGKKESERRTTNQTSFFEELGLREDWNRFEDEGLALQERVRGAYLAMARAEPDRWVLVDASGSVDSAADAIWRAVEPRLPSAASIILRAQAQ